MSEYQTKMESFQARRVEILKKQAELDAELAKYKADMKAEFGIADGDRTDVLEIIQTIKRVQGMT